MYKFFSFIMNGISRLVPLDSKMILMQSGRGKADCNPRGFYDFLKNNKTQNYNLKFAVSQNADIEGIDIHDIVYERSLKYLIILMRTKYIVRSQSIGSIIKKKKNQHYIQLWHGSGLKRMGYDVSDTLDRVEMDHVKEWDVFVANNLDDGKFIRKQTGFSGNVQVLGMVRTDFLVKNGNNTSLISNLKTQIFDKHHIAYVNSRVIMYAPTFRDWELEGDSLSTKGIDDVISSIDETDVLLLRLHPLVAKTFELNHLPKNVINVSEYNNLNELLLITNILITDYSSIYTDFSLINDKIIYYNYDYNRYISERGKFYYSHQRDLPGVVCDHVEDLRNILANVDSYFYVDSVVKKYHLFLDTLNSNNDGLVGKRLLEYIKENEFGE